MKKLRLRGLVICSKSHYKTGDTYSDFKNHAYKYVAMCSTILLYKIILHIMTFWLIMFLHWCYHVKHFGEWCSQDSCLTFFNLVFLNQFGYRIFTICNSSVPHSSVPYSSHKTDISYSIAIGEEPGREELFNISLVTCSRRAAGVFSLGLPLAGFHLTIWNR